VLVLAALTLPGLFLPGLAVSPAPPASPDAGVPVEAMPCVTGVPLSEAFNDVGVLAVPLSEDVSEPVIAVLPHAARTAANIMAPATAEIPGSQRRVGDASRCLRPLQIPPVISAPRMPTLRDGSGLLVFTVTLAPSMSTFRRKTSARRIPDFGYGAVSASRRARFTRRDIRQSIRT
jgi:hypothetical protein